MFLKSFNKKGEMVTDETIKWIIYIGILAAVGFAVRTIIMKAAG